MLLTLLQLLCLYVATIKHDSLPEGPEEFMNGNFLIVTNFKEIAHEQGKGENCIYVLEIGLPYALSDSVFKKKI